MSTAASNYIEDSRSSSQPPDNANISCSISNPDVDNIVESREFGCDGESEVVYACDEGNRLESKPVGVRELGNQSNTSAASQHVGSKKYRRGAQVASMPAQRRDVAVTSNSGALRGAYQQAQQDETNNNFNETEALLKAENNNGGRRPVSLPAAVPYAPYRKQRVSYHQDVEEALSSLLWQPYECRSVSSGCSELSSGSSSSTSLSACGEAVSHPAPRAARSGSGGRTNNVVGSLNVRPGGERSRVCELLVCDQIVGDLDLSHMRVDVQDAGHHCRVLVPAALASDMAAANVVGLPHLPLHNNNNNNHGFSGTVNVSQQQQQQQHHHHQHQHQQQAGPSQRVPPLPNVSHVNVNYYRAVPVNVVSSVPTIQCVNTTQDHANVSSVRIVPETQQHHHHQQQQQSQTQHLKTQTQQSQTQQSQTQQSQTQTQQLNSQTQQLNPQTQQLNPQTQQLNPQTQQLNPQTQQINPQTQQLNPQTQQLHSQTQQLNSQTQQLHTQTQQLQSQTQQLQTQTQQLQTQLQQLQPQPTKVQTQQTQQQVQGALQVYPQQLSYQQVTPQQGNTQRGAPQDGIHQVQQRVPQQDIPQLQQGVSQQGVSQQGVSQQGVSQSGVPQQVVPQQSGPQILHQVVPVHLHPAPQVSQPTQLPCQEPPAPRTFISTEAQTDDTAVGTSLGASERELRRRERRERRHQRRLHSAAHPHGPGPGAGAPGGVAAWQTSERLPDLLNSHLPPPYSTLAGSGGLVVPPPPPPLVPSPVVQFPGQVPLVAAPPPPPPVPAPPSGFRFPFPTAAGFRRCRTRLGPRYSTEEPQPKSCCGLLVSRPGSLRWFIALIALVAVCCVLVGTVLGAMRPAGRDHLTVSLLMIGVGIVLVTVSGVAWRLTSQDAPSCRAMLGLEPSDGADVCTRRFVPRLPPSYGRPHHPYAAMIYPEFQYRPPPPTYQASMQEYRLRLLLLDRGNTPHIQNAQHSVSPPPTYRSHTGSLLRAPLSSRRDATQSEYSCPPSYRSRSSSNRPAGTETIVHSREQSLSLSESNHDGSVVNVVNILANQEEEMALENMTLDSLKVVPENEIAPLRMLLKSSSGSDLDTLKDGNLVTIVQKADQNPVIVTVSGSQMSTTNPEVGSSNQIPSEMEILAHL